MAQHSPGKPDWVILRGWGVMNPVALKTAQKVGFPADHIIGNIWSNSEDDAAPAGAAAKGFIAITTHPTGTDFPVLQGIQQQVVARAMVTWPIRNASAPCITTSVW